MVDMKNNKDLTSGSVGKNLFLFSMPMIAGNLLQQCYNLVDTWIVGKYVGANALSAVGSAYSLMTFLNSILIGMCMGAGALFAFYKGSRDYKKLKESISVSFILLGVIAVFIFVCTEIFATPILKALQTPKEIFFMMKEYLIIIFAGIVFVYLYNYFAFLLRAEGRSVVPLVFLGASSLLNIALDFLFVVKFNMEIAGAAWATLIAQVVLAIGIMIYTWGEYTHLRIDLKSFAAGKKRAGEIFKFSALSSIQQSVMNFGILMIQGLVNSFGVSVMAAFAAGVKIDTLAYMPAQEFGNAYSIFISQNYGAAKKDRIKKSTRLSIVATTVLCLAVSIIVFVFAPAFIKIFVSGRETEIIAIGVKYLRIEGTFYILIGILFLLYGYFRGINKPIVSLILTIISLGIRVLLAYILSVPFGVTAIWWSIPIGWLLADIAGLLIYKSRKNY